MRHFDVGILRDIINYFSNRNGGTFELTFIDATLQCLNHFIHYWIGAFEHITTILSQVNEVAPSV